MVIPVGVLILVYITYPLYSLVNLSGYTNKDRYKHTLPKIERNCDISFVRENMLMATVLDSFCIDNAVELCGKQVPFGRAMAIWTLATQDGPQMLIHLIFMFLVQTKISHSETTVIMSLVVSTFAIMISIFNCIMCSQNVFDPILLEVELKNRADKATAHERKIRQQKAELKAKMMEFYNKQAPASQAAKLAAVGKQ